MLSFSKGCSPKLQQIAHGSGGRGKYVKLDPWYRQLVYLQDFEGPLIRETEPLDMKARPKV